MQLVEQHVIDKKHKYFEECDRLCFLSKNLYNIALYTVKKHYDLYKVYLNYNALDKIFNSTNQTDYDT